MQQRINMINSQNFDFNKSLLKAIQQKNSLGIEDLLKEASKEATNAYLKKTNRDLMKTALETKNKDIVNLLCNFGIKFKKEDFIFAAKNSSFDIFKEALDHMTFDMTCKILDEAWGGSTLNDDGEVKNFFDEKGISLPYKEQEYNGIRFSLKTLNLFNENTFFQKISHFSKCLPNAIRKKDLATIKNLLEEIAKEATNDYLKKINPDLMKTALKTNDEDIVKLLVNFGLKVKKVDLIFAHHNCSSEIFKELATSIKCNSLPPVPEPFRI